MIGTGNTEQAITYLDEAQEERLATVLRWHCEAVVGRCGGNRSAAARRLGISRATLRRRLGQEAP